MGAPVITGLENFEEVILKLPIADRTKLAHWILESVVEEVEPSADETPPAEDLTLRSDNLSSQLGEIRIPEPRSNEERLNSLTALNANRNDKRSAEEIIDEIYSARGIDEPKSFL